MQKTCIVVPCYNEANRLSTESFKNFTQKHNDVYFVFVNNGSKDETGEIISHFVSTDTERFLFIDQKKNWGKAEAVREGMLSALTWKDFDFIGYFDADLSTPLEEIHWLLDQLKNSSVLLAFGSREKTTQNTIERNALRHNFGRLYAGFITSLLSLDVYDTQCGAKIFRASIVKDVFSKRFIDRWLFDVEILCRIKKLNKSKKQTELFKEVVLREWKEKGDSRIRKIDLVKLPVKTIKIFFRYL